MKLPMKIPKIGKRGLFGVIVFALGAYIFIFAHSIAIDANRQMADYQQGTDAGINNAVRGYYNDLSSDSSHMASETAETRSHSMGIMIFGAALIGWGFWKYGLKSPAGEKP